MAWLAERKVSVSCRRARPSMLSSRLSEGNAAYLAFRWETQHGDTNVLWVSSPLSDLIG